MQELKKIIDKLNSKKIIEYLEKIISIPSPTGYTEKIKNYLIDFAKTNNISYKITNKGAVVFIFGNFNKNCEKYFEKKDDQIEKEHKFVYEDRDSSKNNNRGICFAAHIDTLGLMVKSISDDVIKVEPINGIPAVYAIGDYVIIEASDGFQYNATILPKDPAAHVNKKIHEITPKYEELFLRIDHKFLENENIKDHINIGDYVFLDPKFKYIDGFVKSRFLDDKASCSIFLHIAEILKDIQNKGNLTFVKPIYMYFNITEETGQGISNLPDIDELYIVDMGVVGDEVNGNEYSVSICQMDSSGPYNFELTKKLEILAKKNDIKYVKDIFPYYGSDGSSALRAGLDVKVALFGVGVSASHGYERTHEIGLLNTAKLMSSIIEEVISWNLYLYFEKVYLFEN